MNQITKKTKQQKDVVENGCSGNRKRIRKSLLCLTLIVAGGQHKEEEVKAKRAIKIDCNR